MNKIILITILIVGIKNDSITLCNCPQLLSQGDCTASTLECAWNFTTGVCAINTVAPTVTHAGYCDNYSQTDCPNTTGCAWLDNKCSFFTGCTPFAKITDAECQSISRKCITDGTHCVEVTSCSSFVKQLPCVKNLLGAYCYWDTINKLCIDANTCDKLPLTLTTDALCRAQISTCTTTGTGCMNSETNCSEQKTKVSCVWNLAKSQACYWNGSVCVDLKCDNAPLTYTTDDACNAFIIEGACTTKQGGGCVNKAACSEAKIQAACVTNSSGQACFWNSTACVDKTCNNAPSTLTANSACSGFISTCITTGAGCVTNTTCSSATIQAACVANASGTTCIWDTTCKEKTCLNAPIVNISHSLCTTYLSSCTVNSTFNGCINRLCSNAPNTLTTNPDCELYLPNSKCITKNGGGCITNTNCRSINTQGACVIDAKGDDCFWDETSGECKDKSCVTAPSTYTDDATCSSYLKTCTSNGAGCVNRTCENLLTADLCTKDLNNNLCAYKGLCYMKQCALASPNLTTHADCNSYLSSCTLSNSGSGCIPIPLLCSAITNKSSCYLKRVVNNLNVTYENCGWNGSQCIDWECTTIATTNTTTSQCEAAYQNHHCVSANPVNGNVAGCIDLPTTCSARKTQDNCEIFSASGNPKCIWNLTSVIPVCVDKSCDTASAAGTTGVVYTFNNTNCSAYISNCIANNTADGCIVKPTSCTSLASGNCGTGSKTTGDCYWGVSCVDKTCANISGSTHSVCNTTLNTCTVKPDASGCMTLGTTCSSYTTSIQCQITLTNKNCIWTGSVCRSATCNEAADSASYDSDSECAQWATVSETCTVLYKVGGMGCVSRSANCTDYTSQIQCVRSILATTDDCVWANGFCYAKSTFATGACSTFKGDQATCESYRLGCTNIGGAIATDSCIFDCTLKSGGAGTITFEICQTFDVNCSINKDGSSCIAREANCGAYADQASCVRTSLTALCVWKPAAGADPAVCQSVVNPATDCALITGDYGELDWAKCQAYNTGCGSQKQGDACFEQKPYCSNYRSVAVCTKASIDGLCTLGLFSCLKPTVITQCEWVMNIIGATDEICDQHFTGCIALSVPNGCQQPRATCDLFTSERQCANAAEGKCYWSNNACIKIATASIDCVKVIINSLTHAKCQAYNIGCTVLVSGNGCIDIKANCSDYTENQCTINTTGAKCYWYTVGTSACIEISSASIDCVKVTTGVTTFALCQAYNTSCSINRAGNACVQLQATCGGYSGAAIAGCAFTSSTSLCIANAADTSCVAASTAATCEAVYLGSGLYSHTNCDKFKTGCTANSGNTACATKTCALYAGPTFDHANCQTWLNTCTSNIGGTACSVMPDKCGDSRQTSINCLRASEGPCVVFGGVCVKQTCDTAAISVAFDTDIECSTYLSTCTVARTGGCQARNTCSAYKSALQCKTNLSSIKCYWNPTALNCVDLQCQNIEQTTSFDSHSECVAVDATLLCTVRAANGVSVVGCMARGACSSYTIQAQCHINSIGGLCEWNTNLLIAACADKACTTAATGSYASHSACNAYLNTCTVAVIVTNGVSSLGGCQTLAACSTYTMQEQCQVDGSSNACGWNGTVCANKACATAPASADYSSDAQCRAYFTGCTVAASGQGCIAIAACESYTTLGQCVSNTTGAACYWNSTASTCITRTCENAPSDTADSTACNTYLTGCTLDSVKCKTKICEDFTLATDSLCSSALSTCTSNGTNCVLRGTCAQATSSIACVTQSNGSQCQWIVTNGNVAAYCTIKTCATATSDIVTESGCQSYFTGCTTKSGGGCVVKGTCSVANVQAACTKDVAGISCQWDSIANLCRNKICGDYNGPTHIICQGISSNCTAGANGFCATISSCSNTTVRGACIQRTNGPCLWIAGYTNIDGTNGACFPYTSCSSISWPTNDLCNLISSNCTTNGANCIGITSCGETNIQGGCVNGYDEPCIQSVEILGSQNAAKCRVFTSCSDAFYASHAACQLASSKCPTNGTSGCISLGACSSYTQAGCYLNNVGVVQNQDGITSTGICIWDTSLNFCRDQICQDLIGLNNASCQQQLSSCTSGGSKCIIKTICQSYAQNGCQSGIGTDGTCIWDSKILNCRAMVCGDISGGITTAVCQSGLSGCISDGIKCIPKGNCSTYTSKISCNSGGLDGVCIFTQSTCKLITSCSDASNDYTACIAVKDRCAWTAATSANTNDSKCTAHTCETYKSTNLVCHNFLNWGKNFQQFCTFQNGICTAIDPSTLTSANCFSVSGYTYTWSPSSSKCSVCTTPTAPNTTNNINNSNSTNDTITTFEYILTSVIMGYLVL